MIPKPFPQKGVISLFKKDFNSFAIVSLKPRREVQKEIIPLFRTGAWHICFLNRLYQISCRILWGKTVFTIKVHIKYFPWNGQWNSGLIDFSHAKNRSNWSKQNDFSKIKKE